MSEWAPAAGQEKVVSVASRPALLLYSRAAGFGRPATKNGCLASKHLAAAPSCRQRLCGSSPEPTPKGSRFLVTSDSWSWKPLLRALNCKSLYFGPLFKGSSSPRGASQGSR